MNKKKRLLLIISTSIIGVFAFVLAILSSTNLATSYSKRIAASNAKSVTDVTSSSLTMSNGYSASATSDGFTDGDLFSLSSGGYFRTTEEIRGITSIELTYDTGSAWAKIVPCYYDYENDAVVPTSEEWPDASVSADFSSSPVDYFELYNSDEENDVVIKAISITYSCSTSKYSFNVSFTPNWNGKTAEDHAEIYLVGTQELVSNGESQGGWYSYKMSYNAGTYTYSSPNYLNVGIYAYRFVAVENGEDYSWNPCNEDTVSLIMKENTTDIASYSWDKEPGYVPAANYTFNLIINTAGTPTNFGNIQFVYRTSSTGEYIWGNYIGYSWSSSYSYSKEGLDSDYTLYFKIYMWSDNSNIYVCDDGGADFVLVPSGASSYSGTLSFTYSKSSTIIGDFSIDSPGGDISHPDVALSGVYDTYIISPTFSSGVEPFTASYSGENIRIDNNSKITGIKAGTSTTVTLITQSGSSCTFEVAIPSSTYVPSRDTNWCDKGQPISTYEGWFTSTSVEEISDMSSSFYNGIDTSSFKALIDNGTKFYNTSGVEQHLFYILKDNGVNWIRLKLWVDPETSSGLTYGGGESNLENTLWMAYEAKAAGLNLLLDFHYSDFWTHPGQQILPKSWNDCNSKTALCNRIKSYTTETLEAFEDANCLPDMVQLGNEISSGIYLTKYSGSTETFDGDGEPSYSRNSTSYSYGTKEYSEYYDYIKAGSEGVDAVDSSIKKVIHWAKGPSISGATITNFFNNMPNAYYDYAAISYYPYYCFDNISDAATILNSISITKPWFVAEMSYPFSGYGWTSDGACNFIVSYLGYTGDTSIYQSYAFNAAGQANLIHDLTNAVVNAGGLGMFYWESAWVPNLDVGWAGSGSKNTWGNQGFFSFDGKAIANIDLFKQMSPYI